MSNNKPTALFTVLFISIVTIHIWSIFAVINKHQNNNNSKIDLPEEWELITPSTPIQGHIDNNGILHIEFIY